MIQGNYLCNKCRNKVSLEHIRYDTNGRDLICEDCYSKKSKNEKIERRANNKVDSKIQGERIRVICTDCRYKFSIKRNSNMALRCPYCGRTRLVKDETSVDELIKEVAEKGEVF